MSLFENFIKIKTAISRYASHQPLIVNDDMFDELLQSPEFIVSTGNPIPFNQKTNYLIDELNNCTYVGKMAGLDILNSNELSQEIGQNLLDAFNKTPIEELIRIFDPATIMLFRGSITEEEKIKLRMLCELKK